MVLLLGSVRGQFLHSSSGTCELISSAISQNGRNRSMLLSDLSFRERLFDHMQDSLLPLWRQRLYLFLNCVFQIRRHRRLFTRT
ncbi:MAG: hypothetical protein QOH42_1872 [Blastocatellia bacterium]|nr:hypothetical protein [Blastocatellia bacterium]